MSGHQSGYKGRCASPEGIDAARVTAELVDNVQVLGPRCMAVNLLDRPMWARGGEPRPEEERIEGVCHGRRHQASPAWEVGDRGLSVKRRPRSDNKGSPGSVHSRGDSLGGQVA